MSESDVTLVFDKENPSNAIAVMDVLTAATFPVPNLLITLALNKLEITVPTEINNEIQLTVETGNPNSR